VTITGIGFNSSSIVKFNGTAASSVIHVSSTQLKATVPSTATTGPITVTNTTAPTGTVSSGANYTKT
jgi:IPT/TIG domain-containing protein